MVLFIHTIYMIYIKYEALETIQKYTQILQAHLSEVCNSSLWNNVVFCKYESYKILEQLIISGLFLPGLFKVSLFLLISIYNT